MLDFYRSPLDHNTVFACRSGGMPTAAGDSDFLETDKQGLRDMANDNGALAAANDIELQEWLDSLE